MKITEEQIREISKKVGAKYHTIFKEMVENGKMPTEKYVRELREQQKQEMDDEIAKLKNQ